MGERTGGNRWKRLALTVALALTLGLGGSGCEAARPGGGADTDRAGDSAHGGSVDEQTRREIVSALTSAGVTPEAGSELLIRRDLDETNTVIVTGRFAALQRPSDSAAYPGVYELTREPGGEWRVRPER